MVKAVIQIVLTKNTREDPLKLVEAIRLRAESLFGSTTGSSHSLSVSHIVSSLSALPSPASSSSSSSSSAYSVTAPTPMSSSTAPATPSSSSSSASSSSAASKGGLGSQSLPLPGSAVTVPWEVQCEVAHVTTVCATVNPMYIVRFPGPRGSGASSLLGCTQTHTQSLWTAERDSPYSMSSFYVLGNCVAELGREGETILAAESKMYARLRLATISGWKVLRGGGGGYGGKSSGFDVSCSVGLLSSAGAANSGPTLFLSHSTQQASQGQSQVQAGQKVIVVEFDYPPLESELKTQDGLNDQKLVEEFWNLMTGQQQARPLEAQLQIIASQHQSVMQQIQQKQVALQTSHQNQAPQSELQQISQAISQLKSSAMSLDAENLRIRQRIQDFHNALPLKIVDPSAASASADSNSAAPPPVGKFEAVVTTVVPNYQSYGLPSDYTLKHAAVQYAKLIMDTNS